MKKSKRLRPAEAGAGSKTRAGVAAQSGRKKFVWWPWVAALAALFLAFEIYGPALNGKFVLDDPYLPYDNAQFQGLPFLNWVTSSRPVLMASFWLNHYFSAQEVYSYHATNVFLHVIVSVLVALIAMRLLEWASAELPGGSEAIQRARPTLGIFAGALFLVHPLQTESVAYIASRSEVLSVLFYYAAYCVFLYRRTDSITWPRALAVLVLFGLALGSKEHTLTLPLLLLMTDLYWPQGSLKANRVLYAALGLLGIGGAAFIIRTLMNADTAGLHVPGLTPFTYFLTQCRVVWTYVRFFFLPFGQNADPEVAISHGLLDSGAIFALAAWIAVAGAAWFYRKRWPLASFGVFVFLLLLAPTSSFVPIQDVLQERRLYLPFLGLALVCHEFLRRLEWKQRLMVEVPVLIALLVLTYQRSQLWGEPVALWEDTVAKSPNKIRPRFQLAEAYYDLHRFPSAVANYEIASHLGPPDYRLLVNFGLALDQTGRHDQALEKLQQASTMEVDAEVWTLIGQVYGEQGKITEALQALQRAESINPQFEMTYAIRGNVYESVGNLNAARDEYRHALNIDPNNDAVRQALEGVERKAVPRRP
jgi:protein O-mannosyl-transferase